MKLGSFYYNFMYSITPRKPRLIWRICKNYLQLLFGKSSLLRYIDACVELKCNLKCEHCFAVNFDDDKRTPISDEEWGDIFDQTRAMGNIAVGFTGGEPLMNPRLESLIKRAHPEETLILVCTNGTLLTAEKAVSLYKAGVDVVQISIESLDAEEHSRFRGNPKAYELSMQGIENALAAGIRVCVVPVVSHQNVNSPGFRGLLEWAHKKNLVVNLAFATPMGRWNDNSSVLLTKEDTKTIDELVARYPNVRRDFETNYYVRGCGAAKEKMYFTPFGDVLACPYMHISFGKTKTERVADIQKNMLSIKKLSQYYPMCLMAEDRAFIEGPLSVVLNEREHKVTDWKKVFNEQNNTL